MRTLFTLAALAAASASAAPYTDQPHFQAQKNVLTEDVQALGFTSTYHTTDDAARKALIDELRQNLDAAQRVEKDEGLLSLVEIQNLLQRLMTGGQQPAGPDSAGQFIDDYDSDGDGMLTYDQVMRALYADRGGPDEQWPVWPADQSYHRFRFAMQYADATRLNAKTREFGFTTTLDDLPEDDPDKSELINFCDWWNEGKTAYPNGLRDQSGIAAIVEKEGQLSGDWAGNFIASAMSRDEDDDGKIAFNEFMGAWYEYQGRDNTELTIWPSSRCWQTSIEPIFWVEQSKRVMLGNPGPDDGPEPMCQLNDELIRIGYNTVYDDATDEERLAIDTLINAADVVSDDADGMIDYVELTSIQLMIFEDESLGATESPADLMSQFDGDADGLLNFRELMRMASQLGTEDIDDIWPCMDRLPLRFRLHSDVVGNLVNPVFCAGD